MEFYRLEQLRIVIKSTFCKIKLRGPITSQMCDQEQVI